MNNGIETVQSLRIAILSHPRTNSNLLVKLLSGQPDVVQHTYPFMAQFMWGSERRLGFKTKQAEEVYEAMKPKTSGLTAQKALDDLERQFGEDEAQGKIALVKEHVCWMMDSKVVARDLAEYNYPDIPAPTLVDHKLDIKGKEGGESEAGEPQPPTNPTYVPDRFMNSLIPVFIIRHPAWMLPSYYKNMSEYYGATTKDNEWQFLASYHWCRILFDYYDKYFVDHRRAGFPQLPMIVDGDDLVQHTEDIMTQLCDLLHLDPSNVKYTWESTAEATTPEDSEDLVKKMSDAFIGSLAKSTGVNRDAEKYARPLDLEEEERKWAEKWGDEAARDLLNTTRKCMADYDYLMQRRIKPSVTGK